LTKEGVEKECFILDWNNFVDLFNVALFGAHGLAKMFLVKSTKLYLIIVAKFLISTILSIFSIFDC